MGTTPPISHTETVSEASLKHLLRQRGPFVTVLLQVEQEGRDLTDRWPEMRAKCEDAGAAGASLDAIELQLPAPVPDDAAAIYISAAANSVITTETGEEGPRADFFHVGELPYCAPLLEWQSWRVPHLVVTVGSDRQAQLDVIVDQHHETATSKAPDETIRLARDMTNQHQVELIVVAGADDAEANALAPRVKTVVPVGVDVKAVAADDIVRVGGLANEVVRQLADHVARRTVRRLEDFRFLLEHDGAVQGAAATLDALARSSGDLLLIHDDPSDERTGWFGDEASQVSVDPVAGWHEARMVDVAIRAALLTGIRVQIVPSTGPQGPDENIGLLQTQIMDSADQPTGSS